MSGSVDFCGNCGAPLDVNEDGECRWCRTRVRTRHRPSSGRPRRGINWRWNSRLTAISAIAIGLAAALGVGIGSYVSSHQSGPPTATATSSSVTEPVPPGSTDLQALRADFGPWRQLASGPAGSPALLLLEGGAAYSSERWTVPSTATWWAQDLGGDVSSVTTAGDRATIEDADGVSYTVGVNQAFIISSNPDTVLLVLPSGIVMSMPLAQATAVRQVLGR